MSVGNQGILLESATTVVDLEEIVRGVGVPVLVEGEVQVMAGGVIAHLMEGDLHHVDAVYHLVATVGLLPIAAVVMWIRPMLMDHYHAVGTAGLRYISAAVAFHLMRMEHEAEIDETILLVENCGYVLSARVERHVFLLLLRYMQWTVILVDLCVLMMLCTI